MAWRGMGGAGGRSPARILWPGCGMTNSAALSPTTAQSPDALERDVRRAISMARRVAANPFIAAPLTAA
jgi:hypothetical protein